MSAPQLKGPLQGRNPLHAAVRERLIKGKSLLDVGAGIRPFDLFTFPVHVCLEPHGEYADVLIERGYPVIQQEADLVLSKLRGFDSIYLIDVIEHMDKDVGKRVVEKAVEVALKQVFVFTPYGFMEQDTLYAEKDPWGLNGQYWQHHRSGWMPEDFPGWFVLVNRKYHIKLGGHGAFIAIYTKS